MKCMMSVDGKHIRRVDDVKAAELYHEGWGYIAKSIWKKMVRDVETKTETKSKPKTKSNKLSKSQKRHLRKSNK